MANHPVHARFDGPIVMIGFGSIGRGTLPLLERHIAFDRSKFVVIDPVDTDRKLLDGRSVVITGAGRGLGCAYALAAAMHGANVVVNDLDGTSATDVVDEIRQRRGAAIAVPGDGADWTDAAELTQQCVAQFGPIDCLVNNAHRATTVEWPPDWAAALAVYMEMVKSNKGDVSDMTLAVLSDIRAATLD